MRILTVVGARPQFIKAAVISRAIRDHAASPAKGAIEEMIVHTGQHFDANMSDIFFDELEIPKPAQSLGIKGGTHGLSTGQMLAALEPAIQEHKPDAVLVYGDTNSTLAGALAAVKIHVPVIHIEAGLRSFNRRMPEEINRVVTDHVSSLLCCPSDVARRNLEAEGLSEKAYVTGDVMFDAVQFFAAKAPEFKSAPADKFAVLTLHRAENTDDAARLKSILDGLGQSGGKFLFFMHPRTKAALARHGLSVPGNLSVAEPVGYLDLISAVRAAELVVTDSGGLQKEAFFLGRPCVTIRPETEWVELVDAGVNTLAGSPGQLAIAEAITLMRSKPIGDERIYGDGRSGEAIVALMLERYSAGALTVN